MKKGAIFDLDGTLADSMKVWEHADYTLAERYGFTPDEEYWQKVTSCSFLEGAAYITNRYGLGVSAQHIADELYAVALDDYQHNIKLKDGAAELVKKMKADGLKLAIATSNVEEMTFAVLRKNGILDCFDAFAYCDSVGKNKAYPDVYEAAAKSMGLEAKDCYIFEDVPYALKGAKASGAEVIGVFDGYSTDKQEEIKRNADRYILSLREFTY